MTISRNVALRGFKPQQLGLDSPEPFVHALTFAADGYLLYPCRGDQVTKGAAEAATNDYAELRRQYDEAPDSDFRVRTARGDKLWSARVSRTRNLDIIRNDTQASMPATRVIEREDCDDAYYLFRQIPGDPDFAMNAPWRGTDVMLKSSAPVPGSKHSSGMRWRWRPGHGPDSPLIELPREWRHWFALRATGAISATLKSAAERRTPPSLAHERRYQKQKERL